MWNLDNIIYQSKVAVPFSPTGDVHNELKVAKHGAKGVWVYGYCTSKPVCTVAVIIKIACVCITRQYGYDRRLQDKHKLISYHRAYVWYILHTITY